jgi:D-arabinose 1-dehydrogenase-like Zn-dependent alcohol dehydrogenase
MRPCAPSPGRSASRWGRLGEGRRRLRPGSEVTVSDVELTAMGDEDVRVRIVASGLCHPDVAVQNGNAMEDEVAV